MTPSTGQISELLLTMSESHSHLSADKQQRLLYILQQHRRRWSRGLRMLLVGVAELKLVPGLVSMQPSDH